MKKGKQFSKIVILRNEHFKWKLEKIIRSYRDIDTDKSYTYVCWKLLETFSIPQNEQETIICKQNDLLIDPFVLPGCLTDAAYRKLLENDFPWELSWDIRIIFCYVVLCWKLNNTLLFFMMHPEKSM